MIQKEILENNAEIDPVSERHPAGQAIQCEGNSVLPGKGRVRSQRVAVEDLPHCECKNLVIQKHSHL